MSEEEKDKLIKAILFDEIIRETIKINSYYQDLAREEIDEYNNEKFHNFIITSLKKSIKREENLYQLISNYKEMGDIYPLLEEKSALKDNSHILNWIVTDSKSSYIAIRMETIFEDLFGEEHEEIEFLRSVVYDFIDENEDEAINVKSFEDTQWIRSVLHTEIEEAFLTYFQEYINDPKYREIKDELIEVKYDWIKINLDVEKRMIEKNFKVDDSYYISSSLNSEIVYQYDESYQEISNQVATTNIKELINEISSISDNDYDENPHNLAKALYLKAGLKANFVFVKEETLKEYKLATYEVLDKPDDKYKKSWSMIKDVIEKNKESKSKAKILSLRKPKE